MKQDFSDHIFSVLSLRREGERRIGERLLTVYRVARLAAQGDHGLVRILNLSDDGVQLSTRMNLSLDDEVKLDLTETCSVEGRVVWQSDKRCGIHFTEPLDAEALLKRLSDEHKSAQYRQLRLAITRAVVVRSEMGIGLARAQDISQRGMNIRFDGCFTPGLKVSVQIAPGIERCGVVRWSANGNAGIMLTDPLSVEELGSINSI